MRLSSLLGVAVIAAILGLPGRAVADSEAVERHLIIAEDAFLEVEYEAALEELQAAESETGATDEQLARLLALRGTVHFLLDDVRQARVAFVRLLTLDPVFRLPAEHPPRVEGFFEQVRSETAAPVAIDHRPPQGFRIAEAMEIRAEIRGVTAAHSVRIFYRRRGDRRYSTVEMAREEGDTFAGTIPAFAALGGADTGVVEYFIVVALGETRVANEGTPRRPLAFSVTGESGRGAGGSRGGEGTDGSPGVASQWWFWTAIGAAVVVAAGIGLGLAFGLQGSQPTGEAEIVFHFPP